MNLQTDSSPFQSSPLDGNTTSPRLFWQNRSFNSENTPLSARSGSPSPTRRSSIERLQKASRVKNSNILALEQKHEYDPTRLPQVERPLSKVQGNAFGGTGIQGLRASRNNGLGHHRNDSKGQLPLFGAEAPVLKPTDTSTNPSMTSSKTMPSPTKSALSPTRFKSSFDQETGAWSGDSGEETELPEGRYQHKHAKSVTFDTAPPEVNEYEMATPDLSSVGSNSREGSYESEEDDDFEAEDYYGEENDRHEDSFDASLEDTDKTPVVGPEDGEWRQGMQNDYEQSPMPEDAPASSRPQHNRTDSTNSNGDHRPLPPLPGMELNRSNSTTSNGLSATAERMLGANRNLPTPPPASATKSEIQNIGNGKMTLEERLKLMMLSDDGKTAAEQQRERRMRRAGARDRHESQTPEREVQSPPAPSPGKTDEDEEAAEAEDTLGDISGLDEYQLPPRISRESIMRRVNGNKSLERESDYNFSSPPPSSSPERRPAYDIDPDVPLPSCEESFVDDDEEGSVIINRDAATFDDMPEIYERSESVMTDDQERRKEQDDDLESSYSDEESLKAKAGKTDEEGTNTPRAATPIDELIKATEGLHVSGGETNDFRASFNSFMMSKPEEEEHVAEVEPKTTEPEAQQQRPQTPPLTKPEYDGSGWGDLEDEYGEEPGTPDSVIHHPMSDSDDYEDEARDSPMIPEQVATIKSASGSKLKTRPSATPSDLMAMREQRRIVSREVPVPAIPERHRNRLSQNLEGQDPFSASDDFIERHPSFKKRSLTLDLDLGLSLDKDFDRVIEAQKVAFQQLVPPTPTPAPAFSSTQAFRHPKDTTSSSAATTSTDISQNANITSRKQRGYLMRQNTKLVAASDKETDEFRPGYRSAGNSPVKTTRPQSWTVEPWNGNTRQRSNRKSRTGVAFSGPVPPLPGQESNAMATAAASLKPLTEEDLNAEMAGPDSGERGRLFVKVMGVKDLDLPLPRSKSTISSLN